MSSTRTPHDSRAGVLDGKTDLVAKLLNLARSRVGMDLVWVSSFRDDQQFFDSLDGDQEAFGLRPGASGPLDSSYCIRVNDGRLPNLIPDTAENQITRGLEATGQLGIGSYLGVPISGLGGETAGMLCAVSKAERNDLGLAEVKFFELLAAAISELESQGDDAHENTRRIRDRVGKVLNGGFMTSVYQPIVSLSTGKVVGAEALARFPAEPKRPDLWFADAESVGLGVALEFHAAKTALEALTVLPDDIYLGVNASPAFVMSPEFAALIASLPAHRIVIELTEHAAIDDYDALLVPLRSLRSLGARLAIDDVGAGFSSFNHVLKLQPDYVKLDLSIIRDIDTDPARKGLAKGLISVSHDIGASVVAEGVETQGELDLLIDLEVDSVQGFFLARPGPLPLPDNADIPRPRARLTASQKGIANQSDALSFVASSWIKATDSETLIRPILDAVLDRTGLETSYLTFKDPVTGALEHRFVRNAGQIELPEGLVVPWDDTLCKRCRDADINWTADVPKDLPGCDAADALGVQTFLSVPLHDSFGEEVGSLCAASTRARYLGASTIAEVQLMAQLVVGQRNL